MSLTDTDDHVEALDLSLPKCHLLNAGGASFEPIIKENSSHHSAEFMSTIRKGQSSIEHLSHKWELRTEGSVFSRSGAVYASSSDDQRQFSLIHCGATQLDQSRTAYKTLSPPLFQLLSNLSRLMMRYPRPMEGTNEPKPFEGTDSFPTLKASENNLSSEWFYLWILGLLWLVGISVYRVFCERVEFYWWPVFCNYE